MHLLASLMRLWLQAVLASEGGGIRKEQQQFGKMFELFIPFDTQISSLATGTSYNGKVC